MKRKTLLIGILVLLLAAVGLGVTALRTNKGSRQTEAVSPETALAAQNAAAPAGQEISGTEAGPETKAETKAEPKPSAAKAGTGEKTAAGAKTTAGENLTAGTKQEKAAEPETAKTAKTAETTQPVQSAEPAPAVTETGTAEAVRQTEPAGTSASSDDSSDGSGVWKPGRNSGGSSGNSGSSGSSGSSGDSGSSESSGSSGDSGSSESSDSSEGSGFYGAGPSDEETTVADPADVPAGETKGDDIFLPPETEPETAAAETEPEEPGTVPDPGPGTPAESGAEGGGIVYEDGSILLPEVP